MRHSQNNNHRLNDSTKLQRCNNYIYSTIDGEVVLLNIEKGMYFNLNEVGAYIWNILENTYTFEQVINKLESEFEITKQGCKGDTEPFLYELLSNQIIQIISE